MNLIKASRRKAGDSNCSVKTLVELTYYHLPASIEMVRGITPRGQQVASLSKQKW
jgi:hypothetical protein